MILCGRIILSTSEERLRRSGSRISAIYSDKESAGAAGGEAILRDARLIGRMCEGLENRPYMVIDDGWQKNACDGPWDILRDTFTDMKTLADDIRAEGAIPGIWIRYLTDRAKEAKWVAGEMRAGGCDAASGLDGDLHAAQMARQRRGSYFRLVSRGGHYVLLSDI